MDKLENWDKLNKEDYKKQKALVWEKCLQSLEIPYPNISEIIEFVEVATPKTMVRYTKTPNGTAYGYKPTPKQFFRIPKVESDKIDNLYFVGQFVISGGFSATILSGFMCYEKVLKDF
jgi:phytoene dehydrogenase-like protein